VEAWELPHAAVMLIIVMFGEMVMEQAGAVLSMEMVVEAFGQVPVTGTLVAL
jgi:hypothetical protein